MGRTRKYAAGLLVAAGILLAGCGRKQTAQVEITVIHGWGSTEEDHVAMRNIYSAFEEKNPDIKLRLISMPTSSEMISKVEDMITVGEIPDVIFLGGKGRDSIYRFMVENGLALDLMPYVQEDEELKNSVSPVNLDYWTTDTGKLYTMSDVLLLSGGYWYNEDIFRQAQVTEIPRTFEEFGEACRKIELWAKREENGVEPLQIPAEGYLYFTDYFMATGDGSCKEAIERNEILIEERQMQETLKNLENIYVYSAVKAQAYSYRDEISMFNEGKLAMYINGIWAASTIEDDLNVRYALLPSGREAALSCESACLGYMVGNSREEARKEAAIRFLKYMMSSQVQERILREAGQMPANPNISLADYRDEMPRFCQAADTVLAADRKIEVPENLWDSRRRSVFTDNILEVLEGKMNGQTFIYMLK